MVGHRLVALLIEYGIDRVFGLPGGQTLPLYDGIARQQGRINHVLMRDERSAGFAADAYARLTRRVGVCDATVGPGATNLVSPVAEAFCSSIPLLAIVSDIPRAWEYRRHRGNASQAIDQLDLFRSISKWQASIIDPGSLDDMVHTAFRLATTGKPGPVVLSVPDDVGPMECEYGKIQIPEEKAVFPRFRQAPDPRQIERAVAAIRQARKPVIVAGGGVHISGAYQSFQALKEQLKVPVLTSISGKGIVSEEDPMALGVVGTFGNPIANAVLQEADLIIYIGCKIGQLTTLRFNYPPSSVRSIHMDADPEELGRNYPQSIPVLADAQLGIEALTASLRESSCDVEWVLKRYKQDWEAWYRQKIDPGQSMPQGLKPQVVMGVLKSMMREDDLVICDASLSSGWASAFLPLASAGHNYLAPRGLATLGWGAPAAIAAALATEGKQRIIHLAGDGGFGYSVQELETMVRLKLPITTFVFNNSTLAWIKHIQKEKYKETYLSTDYQEVSFARVAEGFGALGYSVTTLNRLREIMKEIGVLTEPVVIDIKTDQWETPVLTYQA